MPLPPYYFPVYPVHWRLLDVGLHAQPLIQSPPTLHVEGVHSIRWIKTDTNWSKLDPKKRSSTVLGDGQPFALRNHDSGRFIPHVPWPLCAGPFLYETLQNSKYEIIFHQPNVLMNGKAVGVFQWLIAPPWRCCELKLPLPKFLAKAGRAGAARKAKQKLDKLADARKSAQQALAELKKLEEVGEALRPAAADTPTDVRAERLQKQQQGLTDAQKGELAAAERGEVLDAYADAGEREREARAAEKLARSKKAEQERLARRDYRTHAAHEAEAAAQLKRAATATGAERESHLAAAERHRAQAQAASSSAVTRVEQARAHARVAQAQGKARNDAREHQADARATAKLNPKHENLHQDATGAGNATVSFPSLLAHAPLSTTVEIRVSWLQICETWGRAWANFALEVLSGCVGVVFDSVLAPGKSAPALWALDLAKSIVNDLAIGSAQKFVMEDKLQIKVGTRLGPVKVSAQFERDARGKWAWWLSAEDSAKRGTEIQGKFGVVAKGSLSDSNVEAVGLSMNKETLSVTHLSTDPVLDYGQGIPEVK